MCVPAGARAREGGSRAVDPPACARAPLARLTPARGARRAGAAWGTVSGGGPSVTSDAAIAIEACANATTSKPRAYAASATRAIAAIAAIVAIAGRVARPEARPCIRHDPHLHSRERLARLPLEQCASRPLAARRRARHGDPLAGARACVGERRVRAHDRLRVCGERIDARPERRAGEHHGMASRASATSTARRCAALGSGSAPAPAAAARSAAASRSGRTACVSEPVGTPGAAPACSKSGTLPAAVRRRAITADLGRRTVKGIQSARGRRRRKRTQGANAGSYRRSLRGRQRWTSEVPQHDKSREIIGLSINHIENDSRLR
ncbi:hypothetical protein [Burkholderia pseudomallei]|uniref:hypothetical protein n=1 Tax=Burkholderia pseudomallei TaxID=28450 RepID=UPI0009771A79|nr:hypothetical protein [Burkholderia pseudomallei]